MYRSFLDWEWYPGYELRTAGIAFHFEGKLPGQVEEGFNH